MVALPYHHTIVSQNSVSDLYCSVLLLSGVHTLLFPPRFFPLNSSNAKPTDLFFKLKQSGEGTIEMQHHKEAEKFFTCLHSPTANGEREDTFPPNPKVCLSCIQYC